MKKIVLISVLLLIFFYTKAQDVAQVEAYFDADVLRTSDSIVGNDPSAPRRFRDISNLGLGFGIEQGGLGLNFTVYPQKNIGLVLSGGFRALPAIIKNEEVVLDKSNYWQGYGVNVGVKLRVISDHKSSAWHPYVQVNYGTNGALVIVNDYYYPPVSESKRFVGYSTIIGIDYQPEQNERPMLYFGFWFRNTDKVQDYIDSNSIQTDVINAMGFTVGLRFVTGFKKVK